MTNPRHAIEKVSLARTQRLARKQRVNKIMFLVQIHFYLCYKNYYFALRAQPIKSKSIVCAQIIAS